MQSDFRECTAEQKARHLTLAKLRVNIKSLAAESRFIRAEAARVNGKEKSELNYHRTHVVRDEARIAQWLYAFVRGRGFSDMEHKPINPHWLCRHSKRLKAKADKHGVDWEKFTDWLAQR